MKTLISDAIRAKNLLFEKIFIDHLDFPDKLSFRHFRVLLYLKDHGAGSLNDIGMRVKITKTNLSPVIHYLEKLDYLTLVQDKVDKRVWRASITPSGTKLCEVKNAEIYSNIGERLKLLKPGEREMLAKAFEKIIHIFKTGDSK